MARFVFVTPHRPTQPLLVVRIDPEIPSLSAAKEVKLADKRRHLPLALHLVNSFDVPDRLCIVIGCVLGSKMIKMERVDDVAVTTLFRVIQGMPVPALHRPDYRPQAARPIHEPQRSGFIDPHQFLVSLRFWLNPFHFKEDGLYLKVLKQLPPVQVAYLGADSATQGIGRGKYGGSRAGGQRVNFHFETPTQRSGVISEDEPDRVRLGWRKWRK